MRIFWQESTTFMKFLPKAVKSELRLVRFLNKKLNVAKKSLHVVPFTSKSLISSKVKACEMQNLQGTWKFPCMTQAIYLTCKHMERYMEISMYLATQDMACRVHGNFHVPCKERYGRVHGNFHVSCKETYGKVHGNFHVPKCDETYGKVHGNFHVPCNERCGRVHGNFHTLPCFVARYMEISMYRFSGIGRKYTEIKFPCTSVSVLPKETWKIPYTCVLVEKYIEEIY